MTDEDTIPLPAGIVLLAWAWWPEIRLYCIAALAGIAAGLLVHVAW